MPRRKTSSPAPSSHASSRDEESSAPPSEHDAAGCASKPRKRKKRQAKLPPLNILSDKDRVTLMEWVQQHPMLYDKACDDYNNKETKKQLYQDKARELGVAGTGDEPGLRLQTWVKTQRDKVGRLMKLSKEVSGSGTTGITAENVRFLKRFGWIHQFRNVKNIGTPSVAGLKLKKGASGGRGEPDEDDSDEAESVEDNEEEVTEIVDDSRPRPRCPSASSKPSGNKGRSRKKGGISISSDLTKLSRQLSSTRATITKAMNVERGCESQRMFAELVFHETSKMDEEVWNAYYLGATQQLNHFRSLQIMKNQERQQTQQELQLPPHHSQPPLQHSQPPPQHSQPPLQPFQAPPQPFQAPPQPFQAPPQPFQAPPQPFQAPPQPFQAPPQPFQAPPQPSLPPPQPFQAPQ